MLKEALLWEEFTSNSVRCQLCMRKCMIDEGKMGWCNTRLNKDGKLYSVTYGRVASLNVSAIEKKQMYKRKQIVQLLMTCVLTGLFLFGSFCCRYF